MGLINWLADGGQASSVTFDLLLQRTIADKPFLYESAVMSSDQGRFILQGEGMTEGSKSR